MDKTLLAVFAFSISLVACNNGANNGQQAQGKENTSKSIQDPEKPYDNCKPTAIVRSGKTYPIKWKEDKIVSYMGTEYVYDEQGRIIRIGNYFEYAYNPDGSLKTKVSKDGPSPMTTSYIYEDGVLVKRKENIPEDGIENTTMITCNAEGKIIKEEIEEFNGKSIRIVEYAYDDSGNLAKISLTSNGILALEATYKYDDKPSITALTMPKPTPEPLSARSPNNVTEINKKLFAEDGKVIKTENVEYKYTYKNGRVKEVAIKGRPDPDKYLYEDCPE